MKQGLRMSRLVAAVGALSLMAGTAVAHGLGPHVHGAAELRIAIDGPELEIQLETPLENLLGFEHAPRDDSERTAVRAMAARLRQPDKLFVATPAALCTPVKTQLVSSALPPQLLGEAPSRTGTKAEGDGHADLDATFVFRCAAPDRLQGLDTTLLQTFPGIRSLKVEVAGPRGQASRVLSPGRSTVRW